MYLQQQHRIDGGSAVGVGRAAVDVQDRVAVGRGSSVGGGAIPLTTTGFAAPMAAALMRMKREPSCISWTNDADFDVNR